MKPIENIIRSPKVGDMFWNPFCGEIQKIVSLVDCGNIHGASICFSYRNGKCSGRGVKLDGDIGVLCGKYGRMQ